MVSKLIRHRKCCYAHPEAEVLMKSRKGREQLGGGAFASNNNTNNKEQQGQSWEDTCTGH